MVITVTRDAELFDSQDDDSDVADPAPGEPVGRVKLPTAPEVDDTDSGGHAHLDPAGTFGDAQDSLRQKVIFGVIAVLLMALALIVMLQGVFEQKMPV
jgi:hypothetical protein